MKLGKFIAICLDEFIFLLIIQVCIHILDFIISCRTLIIMSEKIWLKFLQ